MSTSKRANVVAVHSVDRFVLSVPNLDVAEHFYRAFGLQIERHDARLDLRTFSSPHCWGQVYESKKPKKLEYLRMGAYAEDIGALKAQLTSGSAQITQPHPLGSDEGFWTHDPDGVAVQVVVADKVSPSERSPMLGPVVKKNAVNAAIGPMRSERAPIQPVRLSHVLLFCTDINRAMQFYCDGLGFRLSDRSGDILAFTHGAHTSDHHMLALAKSDGPGLHHASWIVNRIDEIGMGMEQMMAAGYHEGWGVGRHVIGSNYFYYARDPWGGFCEYACDIDFIDASTEWPTGDYPAEDSMYLWGPTVPDYFITNPEAQ